MVMGVDRVVRLTVASRHGLNDACLEVRSLRNCGPATFLEIL